MVVNFGFCRLFIKQVSAFYERQNRWTKSLISGYFIADLWVIGKREEQIEKRFLRDFSAFLLQHIPN